MKLYRVTVEHTFFMVSEDDELDMLDAEDCARLAVKDEDLDLLVETEVTKLDEVPEMYRDTYPYGDGGTDRTVKEWLVG